jgi:hypothetical protein
LECHEEPRRAEQCIQIRRTGRRGPTPRGEPMLGARPSRQRARSRRSRLEPVPGAATGIGVFRRFGDRAQSQTPGLALSGWRPSGWELVPLAPPGIEIPASRRARATVAILRLRVPAVEHRRRGRDERPPHRPWPVRVIGPHRWASPELRSRGTAPGRPPPSWAPRTPSASSRLATTAAAITGPTEGTGRRRGPRSSPRVSIPWSEPRSAA